MTGVFPSLTLAVALSVVLGTALQLTTARASEEAGKSATAGEAANRSAATDGGAATDGVKGTDHASADADPAASGKWRAAPPSGWFGRPSDLLAPPYVDGFDGFDLTALASPQRESFIHRANTELCTCGQSGCLRHTLGFCLRVDPGCPRARRMLREIYDALLADSGPAGIDPTESPEGASGSSPGASPRD